MTKAVFLDAATVAGADPLQPACATSWEVHQTTAPAATAERIADAAIAITNKVRIGAAEFAAAKQLKLIVVAATGYDIIDLDAAARHGVAVANSPGYSSSSVPEHAIGLMFAVARSIVPLSAEAGDGTWTSSPIFCLHTHPIVELRGLTVGLVGSGSLGRATGDLCSALGMQPVYLARDGASSAAGTDGLKRLAWEELLAGADILSLHCPLDASNRNMIDAHALRMMKRSCILINTARGGLVDAAALATALETGEIAGAGIDVLDPEPPPADHPLLACSHPGLVVTPHVAWASRQSQQRLAQLVADTADAFFSGRPQHIVGR